jgi:hypothetical protein
MLAILVLISVTFSLFGFIIGIWAKEFRAAEPHPDAGRDAADLPGRRLLFDQHAADVLAAVTISIRWSI